MRRALRLLANGLFALLFTALAFGQGTESGGIRGVVRDSSGALVRGATVIITNEGTGVVERQLVSDSEGNFVAALLPPGGYKVEVRAQGFRNYAINLPVRLNEMTYRVISLAIGTATDTVG